MYLVNAKTLALEEFTGKTLPPYAILSHRWGENSEELTFKEVFKKRTDQTKDGYIKMAAACSVASTEHDLEYLWIDTCCIDKKDSAALTEAINSMYRWYAQSAVCIAYLRDVQQGSPPQSQNKYGEEMVKMENSNWFSRAWTLQELLAPTALHFYDSSWAPLGTKESLTRPIGITTGIPEPALTGETALRNFSIAQKMYWASARDATREEDIAYSLLGLFDVSMPLIYGEGQKAFLRLQEEIIRRTSDHTFLFWGLDQKSTNLFARHPAQFADYGSEEQIYEFSHKAVNISNIGLEMELKLRFWDWDTYCIEYYKKRGHSLRCRFVVLFRLDRRTRDLYRINHMSIDGTVDSKFFSYGRDWEPRRVTLLRRSFDEDHLFADRSYTSCRIEIIGDTLKVIPDRDASFLSPKYMSWEGDWASGGFQSRPVPPSTQNVARVKCELDSATELSIELCFGFDHALYVYVVRHTTRPPFGLEFTPIQSHNNILFQRERKDLTWQESRRFEVEYAEIEGSDSIDRAILCRNAGDHDNHFDLSDLLGLESEKHIYLSLLTPLSGQMKRGKRGNLHWMLCIDDGYDNFKHGSK